MMMMVLRPVLAPCLHTPPPLPLLLLHPKTTKATIAVTCRKCEAQGSRPRPTQSQDESICSEQTRIMWVLKSGRGKRCGFHVFLFSNAATYGFQAAEQPSSQQQPSARSGIGNVPLCFAAAQYEPPSPETSPFSSPAPQPRARGR